MSAETVVYVLQQPTARGSTDASTPITPQIGAPSCNFASQGQAGGQLLQEKKERDIVPSDAH